MNPTWIRYHEKPKMTLRRRNFCRCYSLARSLPEDEKPEDVRLAVGKCLDALRLVNIDRRIRELSAEIATANVKAMTIGGWN